MKAPLIKYIFFIIILTLFQQCQASSGDRTQFFHNCRENCERNNCSADGLEIQEQAVNYYQQTVFDKLFLWTCMDECQYGCMWRTVQAFHDRGWQVPQFYGKWPFLRFLGIQEPASVLFSMFNVISHWKMIKKFRREVRWDSPCYKLWHAFTAVALNAWIWSIIFHTRDFPLTELLDYTFAYSMVLMAFYCMLIRMIYNTSLILRGVLTVLFLSFFINYFAYLSVGKFSYSFNMATNIVTGSFAGLGWIIWCYFVRKKRPYCRIICVFYLLLAVSMGLELLDFPPLLWTVDAHALWHFSTIPLNCLFYKFIIQDCQYLRKEKYMQTEKFGKQI